MAKSGSRGKILNGLVRKLRNGIVLTRNKKMQKLYQKEGYFTVVAAGNGSEKPEKFVVPLSYLTHPEFVRLLEQAAEEYGFGREGALEVPCPPLVLERLLSERWENCC